MKLQKAKVGLKEQSSRVAATGILEKIAVFNCVVANK